nr:MAG TPA: hypothetical protein [Caudoviricetes sp.]DAN46594.1 MAG TPA: hypothetical protein [Caudoviricetes sp.]
MRALITTGKATIFYPILWLFQSPLTCLKLQFVDN